MATMHGISKAAALGMKSPWRICAFFVLWTWCESEPARAAEPQQASDPTAEDATDPSSGQITIDAQDDAYADTDPSALTDFRTALDPYGTWTDDSDYGTVWIPNPDQVDADFSPYVSSGHWVYDSDYIWVSDYAWGWAPFHYGRWVHTPARGWAWIPGRAYAGAWVTWAVGDDDYPYVGWAAMAPAWIWRGGVAVGFQFAARSPYAFSPARDIFAPVIASHVVQRSAAAPIVGHMRPYVHPVALPQHVLAQPVMHGPPPASLAIDPSHVARPRPGDRGIVLARQFARPSTALPMGAHPPVRHAVSPRPAAVPRPTPRAPAPPRPRGR